MLLGRKHYSTFDTFRCHDDVARVSRRYTMIATTTPTHSSSATFLSLGQKFVADDLFSSGGSPVLTVARLAQDRFGLRHVVLRNDDGREIRAFVEQVELAIKLGNLRPVVDALEGIAC
jgi:hypothetical protein